MIRLKWRIRSVSRPSQVFHIPKALRPAAATGAVWAGLFLGPALVTDGAEPIMAPPESDELLNVVPPGPPTRPARTPASDRPETVRLLPPVSGNGSPSRVSRIDPDVDQSQEADGPAVPPMTPTPPEPAADVSPTQRPSNPIIERAEMLQRDKEQRFDRLHGQLEDLIAKWEEQQQQLRAQREQIESRKTDDSQADDTPTRSPGGTEPSRSSGPDTETTGPGRRSTDSSSTPDATRTAEAPTQTPPHVAPEQVPTEQRPSTVPLPPREGNDPAGMPGGEGGVAAPVIAEGPIDRLGLADSLFASGEETLALELYRQLETGSDALESHDRYWVRYQIGCCYRRLNNIDEAQKWYRGIVADKQAGWVGELARWWLDHLEERFRLRSETQALQQTMRALEKQINEQLNAAD